LPPFAPDPYLESMIAVFLQAGKPKLLAITACMVALIALADWAIGNRASLGVFYILPMMLGAVVLAPWETAFLAAVCSALKLWFDLPSPPLEQVIRFIFAFLAYAGAGLFVASLIRNRRLVIEHLTKLRREQELRREAEDQLRILAESSPAAILTVAANGTVLSANRAANNLFMLPSGHSLQGHEINHYLPVLSDALQVNNSPEHFSTAAQSLGRRSNDEIFLAHTWFSSYESEEGKRLAAIVVDSSEEMREREEQGLQQLMKGNRIAAAAVFHEVRNLCSAISVMCANLRERHAITHDEDLKGLATLVTGLESVASTQLQSRAHERIEAVPLQDVFDDLRIVIEPDWREIGGAVRWRIPPLVPTVLAERHGLLQAFLNLAQNSHRAVQDGPMQDHAVRELSITVSVDQQRAIIRFQDSGPGIAAPQHLFEPFQSGADGSGLGLYVSRAVVRSYGGELRFEADAGGACCAVELQVVSGT
jgi:two-component system, LuxR family, sensor kinase FixL